MKVIQVNSVYGFGSTGSIVANLHENYMKKGIESYVVFSRKDTKQFTLDHVERYYSTLGLLNHVGRALLLDKHGLYSDNNTKKIIEFIDNISPDIVHLHNIHGFYLNYEILFAYLREKRVKVVWTLHDCWSFTGYCSHFEFNNCYEWKNGCSNCKFRNVYPYRILSNSVDNYRRKKLAYMNLDLQLITPSQWLKIQIHESILSDFSCEVINNGIKLNHYIMEKSKGKLFTILAVSNIWSKQKGLNEYIEIAKNLKDDQKLIIVGLSKSQMKLFDDRVTKYGRVDKSVLNSLYKESNIFLNLTLEDTFPTVNIEALSFGCPIVTYNTGGSVEAVTNDTGIIVEKYDHKAILNVIEKLQKNEIELSSSACVERSKIFSLDNMVNNYIDVYNKLIKGSSL